MTYYRRRTLDPWEEAAALAAGALVGMGVAYLARVWLRRETTGEPASPRDEGVGTPETGAAAPRRTTEGEAGRPR